MNADLAKLRALHEAATRGEWKCHDGRDDYEHRVAVELSAYAEDPVCDVFTTPDAALIAAMHEAMPDLIAEITHLRAIAEAVERDATDAARLDWLNDAGNAMDIGVYGIPMRWPQGESLRTRIDAAIDRLLTIGTAGHE